MLRKLRDCILGKRSAASKPFDLFKGTTQSESDRSPSKYHFFACVFHLPDIANVSADICGFFTADVVKSFFML